jgi:hypothetical protein
MATGYILVACFFFGPVVKSVLENTYFFNMQRMGLKIRAAIMGLLYRKANP